MRSFRSVRSLAGLTPVGLSLLASCYQGTSSGTTGAAGSDGATTVTAGETEGTPPASTTDDPSASGGDTGGPSLPPETGAQVASSGLRRLTAVEYEQSVADLLGGYRPDGRLVLPTDPLTPFDNDYAAQVPSQALVEGAELLAGDAANAIVGDAALRAKVLGCTPKGPTDEACLRAFIARLGRRAFRRPMTTAEVDLLLHGTTGQDGALDHAKAAGAFTTGVATVLRTVLQDPRFLYRVELGTPVPGQPGVFALDDFELATRIAYLVWGSGPSDALLDQAEAGELHTASQRIAAVRTLWADPRARDRVDRFHALWLGYVQMSVGGDLAAAMRQETKALVDRIVFDDARAWHDLFRADETYVDAALAAHYGLTPPAGTGPGWVTYDRPERRGLLAHGSFLSVGGKFDDTSPVQRGKLIRTRLLCQVVPPPPPTVDVDQAPTGAICKEDRYAMHRTGGCASCHALLDPVGFGLEQFDATGRFRTHERDNPATAADEGTCAITGTGELQGIGSFSGPAELGALALSTGLLDGCVAQQLYRFAMGRAKLDDQDHAFIDAVTATLEPGQFTFDALIVAIVGHPAFAFRREEP